MKSGVDSGSQGWLRDVLRVLLVSALACSLFAGSAALLLPVLFMQADFQEPGLNGRLLVKGVLFLGLAVACLWALWRVPANLDAPKGAPESSDSTSRLWYVAGGFLLMAALAFPNLDGYPWTAPDELHHLVVAKNLAEHHAYGSGHPDTGFEYFDPYDSVGVSVLGPIAGMFKVFGASVPVARWFIVGSLFLLALGLIQLLRLNGLGAACGAAAILLVLSFGTVYLSRSLYGEVPAMMYLVWGLVAWQKGLNADRVSAWLVLAGGLFGLAVLAKTFVLIVAFGFAAVYLSDLVGARRMRVYDVAIPAGVMLLLFGVWSMVVSANTDSGGSMAVYYRHYLMFGFGGVREGLGWFVSQPLYSLVLVGVLGWSGLFLHRSGWSPPLFVLLVMAVLYGFWWIFFTPGTLPRYLWYTCAVLGMFAGVAVVDAVARLRESGGWNGLKVVWSVFVVFVAIDAGARLYEQGDLVYRHDQAVDERELSAFLDEVDGDARVATTYWPVELSMNFMTSRVVTVVDDWEAGLEGHDLVILNRDFTPILDFGGLDSTDIGRYVIVSRGNTEGSLE